MNPYPIQTNLVSEKNEEWAKSTFTYFVNQTDFNYSGRYYMQLLLRAAKGEIDLDDYKYVLNPYNTENAKFQRRPARLRNMNIITPVINTLMGEKGQEHPEYTVICTNDDVQTQYKKRKEEQLTALFAQMFVNDLNAQGVPTGVESQDVGTPEEAIRKFDEQYSDSRAIIGQQALDYLKYNLRFKDKFLEGFYYWLVFGVTMSFKTIYKDDIIYKILNPINVFPIGLPKSGNLEDSAAVIYREWLDATEIISSLGKYMSEETVKSIENLMRTGTTTSFWATTTYAVSEIDTAIEGVNSNQNYHNFVELGNPNLIEVEHLTWKSYRKVGILKYQALDGTIAEMEVSDTYKLNKANGDISIEWEWYTEWYEMYRINKNLYLDAGDFKKGFRKGIAQRQELSNRAKCKLPYNGRYYNAPSVVKAGLSYQALYNILNFRFELTMARNKDKILMFPIGLIPNKEGWDEDTFMYYAEATQFGFYDETAENASVAIQGIKAVDLGLSQYAASMKELIQGVRNDYWDSIGFNRQRFGETYASDGKATQEQAIFRSSLVSYELFRQFKQFEEVDVQGLLDISQFAWVNGKQANYLNSDLRQVFFAVEPEEYSNASLGVFATDSLKAHQDLQMAKQLLQPLSQNGALGSSIIEATTATSISKMKDILLKAENIQRKFEEQKAEADRASAERIQQQVSEDAQRADELTKYKIDEDNKRAITVAQINQSGKTDNGIDTDKLIDNIAAELEEYQKTITTDTNNIFKKEALDASMAAQAKRETDMLRKKELDLQIAKENKNKYDKK